MRCQHQGGVQRTMRPWIRPTIVVMLWMVLAQLFCTSHAFLSQALVPRNNMMAFRSTTRGMPPRRQRTLPLSMVAKSGGKIIGTIEEFSQFVMSPPSERPVMVFFSAPWCGPCRLSVPVVRDVMKQFAGQIDVVEVCTDDLPDVASDAGVVSIPTIQMYHAGELLDTIVGCVARNVLASAVDKVLEDVTGSTPNGGSNDEKGP